MFTEQPTYTIFGKRAKVQELEESDSDLRPLGRYSKQVQQTLDKLDVARHAWHRDDIPHVNGVGNRRIKPAVVQITPDDEVFWAIHRGRGMMAELSPFVRNRNIRDDECGKFTIELAGTSQRPKIYRIYGGDYMMPMPYTKMAKLVDGGAKACVGYWMTHAYRWEEGSNLFIAGTDYRNYRPNWFGWFPELGSLVS